MSNSNIDIIKLKIPLESNFLSSTIRGQWAITADTLRLLAHDTESDALSFGVSDDSLQVLLAGSQTISGEKTFSADVSMLKATPVLSLESSTDSEVKIEANTAREATDNAILNISGEWDGTTVGKIEIVTGDDTVNNDDGYITLSTAVGGVLTEAMRIEQDGDVSITNAAGGKLNVGNKSLDIGFGTNIGLLDFYGSTVRGAYILAQPRTDWDTASNVNIAPSQIELHVQDESVTDTLTIKALTVSNTNGVTNLTIPDLATMGTTSTPTAITFAANGSLTLAADLTLADDTQINWGATVIEQIDTAGVEDLKITMNSCESRIYILDELGANMVQLEADGDGVEGMLLGNSNRPMGIIMQDDTTITMGATTIAQTDTAGTEDLTITLNASTSTFYLKDFSDSTIFYIDSADFYLDANLTVVSNITAAGLPSGATAGAAGASSNQLWVTASHASLPDGVVMRAA